jgi:hypothetical protein
VPPAFALLPEWFVEDIAEYLLYITRFHYRLLAHQRLDDLMLFMVIFMGSPHYIRNPYLRSKLSEVVHAWLPQGTESTSFVRRCVPACPGTSWSTGRQGWSCEHLLAACCDIHGNKTDMTSQTLRTRMCVCVCGSAEVNNCSQGSLLDVGLGGPRYSSRLHGWLQPAVHCTGQVRGALTGGQVDSLLKGITSCFKAMADSFGPETGRQFSVLLHTVRCFKCAVQCITARVWPCFSVWPVA